MKILLVTGRIAERQVKEIAERFGCDVYTVDVDVASFITPKHLEHLDLSSYDLVLVPGLTSKCNWRLLEEKKGVKIRLGPIHAYDIPLVLKNINRIELSHTVPACRLLSEFKREETLKLIEESDMGIFRIGDVKIGGTMKIVAEIVNLNEMSDDELIRRIEYYIESGADIIDLGIPAEFDLDDIRRKIKIARDNCGALSIDTFDKRVIEIGIDIGVDMVMSLSYQNLNCLDVIDRDVAVVVVERDVQRLLDLVEKVKNKVEKVVADPLLTFDLVNSIIRYSEFRKIDKETPLLFGIGNITEQIDADSIGVNAILAYIAEEIGCQLLFTTEASDKTRGCIRELKIASYMARASRLRKSPPKDLGLDLLVLKEKRRIREKRKISNPIIAKRSKVFERDPRGHFRIWISDEGIVCEHRDATIVGKDAKSIVDTVISLGLVSRLDHSAYLGMELKKAEMALKLGKNYVQDEELKFGIYN